VKLAAEYDTLPDCELKTCADVRSKRMQIGRASTLLLICSLLCSCGASSVHQQTEKSPQTVPHSVANPNKFAIIIAGVGGEEVYTRKFTSQAMQLYDVLISKLGFSDKNVFLLTESVVGGPEDNALLRPTAQANAEQVRKAFAQVKAAADPDSLVLVVLIGHGSFDNQRAKFNLVGPDLAAEDYAAMLAALPTRHVVFVNCSSSSGAFLKPLSGQGRIVITATRSGNEQNVTVFADYFIAALADPAADADKNGRISVLEAFNYATKLTAQWYKQKDRLATEHALIDDNGDGVGHEEAAAGDGALAKVTYLDSKPMEQASGDVELAELLKRREQLEAAIEKLKTRKSEMKTEEYEAELERLLIDLAKVNQTIKARKK
jgi:hypothetical protein